MGELEMVEAVVVGGGQAGLATAHELAGKGVGVAVLESSDRIGDQWRKRWDSLRLFTPARFDGLPGMKFPASPASFPAKDEMADYLETYVRDGRIPVRTGVSALKLSRKGDSYIVETTRGVIEAMHVVVATGYQRPRVPAFATDINPAIRQLSASEYRNASQLTGEVLVIGAGTSGVEIAIEAAQAGHKTVLAGRGTGAIPPIIYALNGKFFWFYANRIASVRTPMGRRMKPLVLTHGAPLIRLKMRDAIAAGVGRAPRVVSVADGNPVFDDGRHARPNTIVWCTGFNRDYSWIEMPIVGPDGYPRHTGGVAEGQPGLYFVGLPFQTRLASALIGGVGEDAAFIAATIANRLREARPAEAPAMELVPSRP
jgi:putative flavoprotein involved in K+ transport